MASPRKARSTLEQVNESDREAEEAQGESAFLLLAGDIRLGPTPYLLRFGRKEGRNLQPFQPYPGCLEAKSN